MNIEEVEEPETPKFYRQNPRAPVAAKPKLRKFTDETNMQARNHENSDEFRPTPLRHLDLDTPAFYYYRKNPKCYHTVWGNIKKHIAISCISSTLCAQSCRSTRCFHPMWSPSALLSLPRPRSSCGCHLCGCWRRCAAWIGPVATLKIENLYAISRHSTALFFHWMFSE